MLAVQCHMQHWWQVKTTTVPPKGFTGCTGDTFKAVRVCVLTHRLPTVRGTGFITKLWIRTTTPDFFFFSFFFTAVTATTGYKSAPMLQHCVCASACSKSRGFGWEEVTQGYAYIRVAQIKVYKQRRTPKVALKPQSCWMWAGTPAGARSLAAVFTSRTEVWQRGAEKHSPQMFPLSPST